MTAHAWWPTTAATDFLSPAVVVAGRGASARAAAVLADHLGIREGAVLVAVDDIVANAGLTDALVDGLKEAGYSVAVEGGFGSEPTDDVIDAIAERARRVGAVAVVGIGGGSVLDSSKILALLIRNDGSAADWVGSVSPSQGVAPLLLVPTTSGTGSEATRIAMLTVRGVKRASSSPLYIPRAVIIDPDLVASLPAGVVASTGMDALAHAVESLMSTQRSPLSAHHALRAIELLVANLEDAAAGHAEARARCLWASHLAGQALNAGVVVGHSLAYCLAYEHPMPHGTSCALALPYCLAYNRNLDPEIAADLASALTAGRSVDLRDAAQEVFELAARLGLPVTLDDAGIPEGAERGIAERCVTEYPRPTNPQPLDVEDLDVLVRAMRGGDLDAAFGAVAVAR
ncbi:iron-containing alcohol dehydrogenase [Protaetiibacter sp. SSC-01]|uniref:iron-containing alcohol dehydrogenase family protein n=1 Tax=Protaetiibacter sp. SSC-01 TaxID=2759943 RepID=UPI0016574DF8|nr:iron-containing alcohol dehydrogenase [Protaetiibacter sp. SSC-01]QNO38309.1 iron-containing alcohol dehydrogenase [Protaetiibacter sp. SSC-01]